MPTNLLSLFSIVDYLVAAIVLALPMARLPRAARTVGMLLATLAVIVHASLIFGMHRGGLDLHFFASLSLAGFGVAAMTLLVNLFRPVAALGVIVFLWLPCCSVWMCFTPRRPSPSPWNGRSSCTPASP